MSRLLIIAGLCLLILPFFLLGEPPSASVLELDRQGEVIAEEGPAHVEGLAAGQRQPVSGSRAGGEDSPQDEEQTATTVDRIVVQPRRSVRFRVVDDETEKPIARYHLRIFAVGKRTPRLFHEVEIDGTERIDLPLPRGDLEGWVLDIRSPGYAAFQDDLDSCVDEVDEDENEVCMCKGSSFVGRILDPQGRPASGIEVDANECDSRWTDPKGRYALPLPAADRKVEEILLSAEKADVGSVEFEFRVADYTGRPLPDLMLQGTGVLQGRLMLSDGTPLHGCVVSAQHVDYDEDPSPPPGIACTSTHSDAEGFFRMSGMAPGKYELWIDLVDVDGRKLESSSCLSLFPGAETGQSRTWQFQRLDVEVRLPERFRKCEVRAEIRFPGSESRHSLRWKAGNGSGVRSLPFQAGTAIDFEASTYKGTWAQQHVVVRRGEMRQRVLIELPDPQDWVPLWIELQAPDLVAGKCVCLRVLDPARSWHNLYSREEKPGLFEFRVPPGEQRLELTLQNRIQYGLCGNGIPPRHLRPETEPYRAWLTEFRTVKAMLGRSLHLSWRPRPESSLCWLFEAPNSQAAMSPVSKVRVTRLDPLDPHRRRVLDRNPKLDSLDWGRASWYAPALSAGRHVFRFEAEGFEPVVREVWLGVQQNRLVRIRLHPAISPSLGTEIPPELTEPYRCGRAQR